MTTDELIDAVWPQQAAPTSARANLKTYAWRLRQLLSDSGASRLASRPGMYRLSVAAGETDTDRLVELAAQVRRATTDGAPGAVAALLEQALGLWRGRPFGGLDTGTAGAVATQLEQLHLELREHLAETRVALGHAEEAAAILRAVTAQAPLREEAWVRLVRVLHVAGRRDEALGAYRQACEILHDELGVGPGAALTGAYQRLRGPAPAERVRRELPRQVLSLIGRDRELAAVLRAVTGPASVALVEGMAGVGKTAFAVSAAHRLAPAYPDGQFYLDISGRQGCPVVAAGLDRLLRGIGLPAAAIPSDLAERAALWRSELAGRRVLLVLDGVAGSGELAPLLPGTPGCLTLVTTRSRAWDVDGAFRIGLRPLPEPDAVALFLAAAGPRGIAAQPLLRAVARRCGGLPAALRDAAARLRSRPGWTVQRLAEELDVDPCGALTDVTRRSITDTCASLAEPDSTVWRALGELPEEFGATDVAPATGVTVTAARSALETLVDLGLLEAATPERYRSHPLVRHLARCAGPVATRSGPGPRGHRRVA
ncbi:AfsR/SARP family transcriptional regulator [Micromonospora sp. NBC_01813]|uniref:AfsR/SARP family transcriptional regulator n=1 Tax=Micromonospora sp. NBC_01813 TaxID=2975988 RepID=UPI002DD7C3A7|nr:BTAD domain-containing putative transcriptional regulator [Micromonospora sp. NBC_01813]